MNRQVIVKKLRSWPGRTIVISDIHGNFNAFLKLLNICSYDPLKDRLILTGDLIEKGPENLHVLQWVMKKSKQYEVHALMGNCDFTVKNAFLSYKLDFLKKILTLRKQSILHEMAHSIGLPFTEQTAMETYCQILRQHFLEELSFCNDLPHVIETPDTIYTHAGIQSEENYGDDFRIPMTTPFFFETKMHFKKRVVCGHMPVTEYQRHIAHFDPLFDAQKNIYSIDGGNIVKQGGQLNALIFDGKKVDVKRCDLLPVARVVKEVPYQHQIPLFVTWNRGQVDILRQEAYQAYVYSPYLKRSFWVDREFLENRHGAVYATDYTNYQIPLKINDHVKVVRQYRDKVQIKKDGVLGWTYRSHLKFD